MKRTVFIVFLICVTLHSHAQQFLNLFSGTSEKDAVSTLPTRDVEVLEDGYKVTYTFHHALIQPDDLYAGCVFWKVDGFGMNETPGEPCFPIRYDSYVIPAGYEPVVEVSDCSFSDIQYELTPARQALFDDDSEGYTLTNVLPVNPYDGWFPVNMASTHCAHCYRGTGLCQVEISPIQYNYQSKTIRAYTSITYKLTFIPDMTDGEENGGVSAVISRNDHFLDNIAFGENVNKSSKEHAAVTNQLDNRDFLVLTVPKYATSASRFAEWKKLMGFNVHTVVRESWTSEQVKNSVIQAYAEWPALYYLLIIGDHNDVPAQKSTTIKGHVTDFHYGCINDDYIQDVLCGRLPVSTEDEAMAVVEKIIGYEQMPPSVQSFYENGLNCAYFQDDDNNGYADRRFAQTSEEVRSYLMSQGKTVRRVYTTKPNVIPLRWNLGTYSFGGSIPDDLKKPGFAWDGNHSDITNAINTGMFYVLHRDHGDVTKWEHPEFTQDNIGDLSNGNLLPVVFSMNCKTGQFNNNCFAESFLRKSDGGCVAIFAATESSYSGYNDVLTVGMFDAIWPNPGLSITIPYFGNSYVPSSYPIYALGQVLRQGLVRMTEIYGATSQKSRYTHELFHCFGDPSMEIYTEKPTPFSGVTVIREESQVLVQLEAEETARITAYDLVTGVVQSYLGNSAIIETTVPEELAICVSGHNRIPYIDRPDVLYIQNTNITGIVDEHHEIIKIGRHVTSSKPEGDVTTSHADITLRANKVIIDGGTRISNGSTLKATRY